MSDFDYGDDIGPEVVLDPEEPVVDILDDKEAVILDDEIEDPEATLHY